MDDWLLRPVLLAPGDTAVRPAAWGECLDFTDAARFLPPVAVVVSDGGSGCENEGGNGGGGAPSGTVDGSLHLPWHPGTTAMMGLAALWAASADPCRLLLIVRPDHALAAAGGVSAALDRAALAAREGWLVRLVRTVDVTGEKDGPLSMGPALAAFEGVYRDGGENPPASYDSGLLVASAQTLVAALEATAPALMTTCRRLLAGADAAPGGLRFSREAVAHLPDVALATLFAAGLPNVALVVPDGTLSPYAAGMAAAPVVRPWGQYRSLHQGAGFQVKELTVSPGGVLSLQRHRYRAEHWTVVAGEAEVTLDGEVFRLHPNQTAHVPLGAVHRLANRGGDVVRVIEVQCGSYLGEDDIERFDDIYGRVPAQ